MSSGARLTLGALTVIDVHGERRGTPLPALLTVQEQQPGWPLSPSPRVEGFRGLFLMRERLL